MILTLTPNPSLDLLFTADRLVWDDANRVDMPRRRPGGQGVNVVRAARALDPSTRARAVAPLGGRVGAELRRMLHTEGTDVIPVPIAGDTRVFVGVQERSAGRALLLNPRGPDVHAAEEDAIEQAVLGALDSAVESAGAGAGTGAREGVGDRPPEAPRWLACCGSLLPGLPADFYARVGTAARRTGWRFVVDCDGPPLRQAASEADLLVPNVHEAERLLDRSIDGVAAATDAARALLDFGGAMGVITLGADGAVAATAGGRWHAVLDLAGEDGARLRRDMDDGSAVGAGDAFLAALLIQGGPARDPAAALGDAVAAGAAALLSRGPALVRRADFEQLRPHVRVNQSGD